MEDPARQALEPFSRPLLLPVMAVLQAVRFFHGVGTDERIMENLVKRICGLETTAQVLESDASNSDLVLVPGFSSPL